MEIPHAVIGVRTREYIKKRTLKDGTIREYHYTKQYTPKTNILQNTGKTMLVKRIFDCKDREKIEALKVYCDEMGI